MALEQVQTNGVNNANQTTLDLVAGANITLSASGAKVTITASEGVLSGAQNLVLATPNGSSGEAELRSLVVADLPSPLDLGTF